VLDAFIIERIKREQAERQKDRRTPLRIPAPRYPERSDRDPRRDPPEERDRGVVIIDF
jgi:hypothetical protein